MVPKLRCRRLLQNISSESLLERDLVKSGRHFPCNACGANYLKSALGRAFQKSAIRILSDQWDATSQG
jgi:hypothetical protein